MRSLCVSAANSVDAAWMRFWFAPVSAFNFALFRTGLGLLAFVWFVTLVPDFDAFFGPNSLAMDRTPGTRWFTIFGGTDSDRVLWIGLVLGLAASGALMFGRLTRAGGPALALLVPSMMTENQILWNAGDDLLQSICLLFGLYCLLTPSGDLNVPLQLREAASADRSLNKGRRWLFQLIKIQMSVVYVVAFIEKIPGAAWRDGTASMIVFRLETLERFPTPSWLETNYFIGNVVTWSSLALEALLPFLLWKRKTRPYAIAAGVAFHLVIDWSLTIGLFSWVMALGLVSFLPSATDSWLRSLKGKLTMRLGIIQPGVDGLVRRPDDVGFRR